MTKTEDTSMRVIQTATTRSTSGKSNLTYQIGCTPDSSIHIRITKNTGAGQFSPEWVKVEDIQKAIAEGRKGDPLTSFLLQTLFKGRSVNTPAFVMAALTQEKMLCVLKGKKRGHEFLDPEGFDARMQKLMSSGVKPKAPVRKSTGATKKTVTKKTAVKKCAAASSTKASTNKSSTA